MPKGICSRWSVSFQFCHVAPLLYFCENLTKSDGSRDGFRANRSVKCYCCDKCVLVDQSEYKCGLDHYPRSFQDELQYNCFLIRVQIHTCIIYLSYIFLSKCLLKCNSSWGALFIVPSLSHAMAHTSADTPFRSQRNFCWLASIRRRWIAGSALYSGWRTTWGCMPDTWYHLVITVETQSKSRLTKQAISSF